MELEGSFSGANLVEVKNLTKFFELKSGFLSQLARRPKMYVHAVDGVDLGVKRIETVAVVGESGSGKTTLGLTMIRLHYPTSGAIHFDGNDITQKSDRQLRNLRKNMQIVFQDPSSSLDPRKRVGDSIAEPLQAVGGFPRQEVRERVKEALEAVGLGKFELNLFPHQFSGGQRQRISIARAIIQRPKFIVLDEPTSSLDVSVQSQILVLLLKLQKMYDLSFLLVTHNMSVARYMADRIAVMYLGKIVEVGKTKDVIGQAMHPYTQLLLGSVLEPYKKAQQSISTKYESEMPSQINPPSGCRFIARCPYAREKCKDVEPQMRMIGDSLDHLVACHYAEEIMLQNNVRLEKI